MGITAWFMISVLVAAAIIIVVAAILLARRTTDKRPAVLVVTRFVAVAYAAITAVATGIAIVSTLVSEAVEVTIPVAEFWPDAYPWIDLTTPTEAAVTGGGFTSAHVEIVGLGLDARLWLAGGHALQGATFTLLAIVVALLCHRMLRGTPFRPVLARSIMAAAATIAVGGIAWQLCFGIGGSIASHQALETMGWSAELPSDEINEYLFGFDLFESSGLPEPALMVELAFWPLLLGLVLAAIALVFRHGERLQRDTEGLI